MSNIRHITQAEWDEQAPYIAQVRAFYRALLPRPPLAFVRTFGCQQNVSDSEHIKGMLAEMGFGFADRPEDADLILYNTCAVREHAEDRVFGNVGALKNIKRKKPHLVIAVCGCMVQQPHNAERFFEHYPFVSLVFGTHVLHRFPEFLAGTVNGKKRLAPQIPVCDGVICESVPVVRDGSFRAWLPIMYGCNNFCSYCIVPYVRGRERSRRAEDILAEANELVAKGYKEITLLGQNVNSFGKDAADGVDFPELLSRINAIPGDFTIRFMTSHPKDATGRLFDTIAACEKVERHFHLPFQSGSDRILKQMNRGYTRAHYRELIDYARSVIPGILFTSDVIVGFPGETREDFEQTMSLVSEVGFASLYTFIYSPRVGTPAAQMEDPIPAKTKSEWLSELISRQEEIAAVQSAALVGTTHRALLESDAGGHLEARLGNFLVVRVPGDGSLVGHFATVRITKAQHWILHGELVDVEK